LRFGFMSTGACRW